MQLWLCPLIAFLLGSIPFGLFIARMKGIDIRAHGSGNIGATNVLRVVGKQYGITCLILDALKGYLPVALAITLIRFTGQHNPMEIAPLLPLGVELPPERQWFAQLMQVLCGLLAILGHNYSPWVGFKGGKGIATSAGVLIALAPAAVVILILVWLALFLTTRYVSIASVGAAAVLPPLILFGSWFHGKLAAGTWNKPLLVFSIIIAALAIWKHRTNLKRLREGTEHRFTRKSKP
ncbi:glycerol-3-phosphate 1-O-acyltransferase PlsY [Haloferula sargassicola]|uniref:Glycerol-3-phosphate acyltransferase n=1 Tax=Haloferula sargassicola TaxID=490096 RepID=A0ABP9UJW6_9BACT